MLISQLTPSDSKNASLLHQNAFIAGWSEEDIKSFLNSDQTYGLKVQSLERFYGFIIWREIGKEAEILTIVVSSDFKRKGIGSILLQSLFEILIKKGIESLFIEVAEDDPGAQKFYKNQEFILIGKRPNYYKRSKNQFVSALNYKKVLTE